MIIITILIIILLLLLLLIIIIIIIIIISMLPTCGDERPQDLAKAHEADPKNSAVEKLLTQLRADRKVQRAKEPPGDRSRPERDFFPGPGPPGSSPEVSTQTSPLSPGRRTARRVGVPSSAGWCLCSGLEDLHGHVRPRPALQEGAGALG